MGASVSLRASPPTHRNAVRPLPIWRGLTCVWRSQAYFRTEPVSLPDVPERMQTACRSSAHAREPCRGRRSSGRRPSRCRGSRGSTAFAAGLLGEIGGCCLRGSSFAELDDRGDLGLVGSAAGAGGHRVDRGVRSGRHAVEAVSRLEVLEEHGLSRSDLPKASRSGPPAKMPMASSAPQASTPSAPRTMPMMAMPRPRWKPPRSWLGRPLRRRRRARRPRDEGGQTAAQGSDGESVAPSGRRQKLTRLSGLTGLSPPSRAMAAPEAVTARRPSAGEGVAATGGTSGGAAWRRELGGHAGWSSSTATTVMVAGALGWAAAA